MELIRRFIEFFSNLPLHLELKKEKAMSEKDKEKKRKESIQQNPDQVDDQNKKPVTPEPPQRKDPMAEPESESGKKNKD